MMKHLFRTLKNRVRLALVEVRERYGFGPYSTIDTKE